MNADLFGRVATDLSDPIAPVFYMINQNQAFCVGEINNNPFFGIFAAAIRRPVHRRDDQGKLCRKALHSRRPDAVRDLSGVSNVSTACRRRPGRRIMSTSPAQYRRRRVVAGTYAITNATAGSGTLVAHRAGAVQRRLLHRLADAVCAGFDDHRRCRTRS